MLNIDPQIASALRPHTKFPERCAIVLQRLKFWLDTPNSGIVEDGTKWIWNSIREWRRQFSWLSEAQIRFTFNELEELGLVQSSHFSEGKRATNRSKRYTLCGNRLEALMSSICDTVANGFETISQMDLRHESKSVINNNQFLLTEKECVCSGAVKIEEEEKAIETREEWPAIEEAIAKLGVNPDRNLTKLCEDKFSALGQTVAVEVINNAIQAVGQIENLREPAIAALKSAIADGWKPQQVKKSASTGERFRAKSPIATETAATEWPNGDWLDDVGNLKQEFVLWKAQRILADPPFKRKFSDIYAAIAYLKAEVWASFNGAAKLAAHWEEYLGAIAHRIGTGALCAASGGSSAAWKPSELSIHAGNVQAPASDPAVEASKRLALASGFSAESNPIKLLTRALPSENSEAYKLFSSQPECDADAFPADENAIPSLEVLNKIYSSAIGKPIVEKQIAEHPEWGYVIAGDAIVVRGEKGCNTIALPALHPENPQCEKGCNTIALPALHPENPQCEKGCNTIALPALHPENPQCEKGCNTIALPALHPKNPQCESSLAERIKRRLQCGAMAQKLITDLMKSLDADERLEALAILNADERGKAIAQFLT